MISFENIIFDLGGVILDVDYNLTRRAFENLGVVDFDKMYSQANADKLFENLECGKISPEDFFKEFNRCTGLNLSEQEITKAWDSMLIAFRRSTLDCIEQLKKRYNLYLFSNTNFIHMAAFHRMFAKQFSPAHLNDYFKKAYYSCEIGLRKPNLNSYSWLLDHAQLTPGTTVFIDDSIQNIEAARQVGLHTILLEPGKRVEDLNL